MTVGENFVCNRCFNVYLIQRRKILQNKKNKLGATFLPIFCLSAFAFLLFFGGAGAYADDNRWHDSRDGHHYERRDHWDNRYHDHNRGYKQRVVYITPSYQPRYQTIYYSSQYPDVVASRYGVGDYLPRHVRCYEPSRDIVAVLPPIHRGTRYVQVNDNVYLVSEASRQILNAVVLLSAVR